MNTGSIIASNSYYNYVRQLPEAFDGDNTATYWVGTFDGDGKMWLGRDFGAPTTIRCVRLYQEELAYFAHTVIFEVRNDDSESWVAWNNMGPAATGADSTFVLQDLATAAPHSESSPAPSTAPSVASS